MNATYWLELILALLSGLATAIPLAIQLVKYVKKAAKEKNWGKLLSLVLSQMEIAERMFATGEERKEYVMHAVQNLANTVDYDVDPQELEKLIDSLCDMSRAVNAPGEFE